MTEAIEQPETTSDDACELPARVGAALEPMLDAARQADGAAHRPRLLAAVSGGMDSAAMLDVLARLAGPMGLTLLVAHLDHGIRPDSRDDADFVSGLAGRLGLAFITERRDVPALAQPAESIEMAARRERYAFLLSAAEQARCTLVATGHHADDNVETILANIIAGTHLRGLRGMPRQRPLCQGVTLIRPMLDIRRRQIEQYCVSRGLDWREDSTNADTSLRRNRIRRELLPAMRSLNGHLDEALLALGRQAAQADDALQAIAAQTLKHAATFADSASIDQAALLAQPQAVRAYVVREMLARGGLAMRNVSAARMAELERLIVSGRGAVNLPGGFRAAIEAGRLVVTPTPRPAAKFDSPAGPNACAPDNTDEEAVKLDVPVALPGGTTLLASARPWQLSVADALDSRRRGIQLLDADAIDGPLILRRRRPGDRFVPLGSTGSQSVSDMLTNLKLPQRQRSQAMLLCDRAGVLWLVPMRIAARAAVTQRTRRVLAIELTGP